jgi:amino acid transporter
MNVVWAALIVIVTTSVAVAAMLLVRRRAPDGSYFADGDRAAGVFGVLATGFSVLLGFIVFLAFESYDQSRAGAEQEAQVLAQQVETAQFFPRAPAERLTGELVCYGRSVVHVEWPRSEAGTLGDQLNPWGVALFRTIRTVRPETNAEASAYDEWLDQRATREAARIDRIHGAAGVIPTPLWIVLGFMSLVIFVFMLFFADSGERARTQALMMATVVSTIVALLLLIRFLDTPFHSGVGGVRPVAMERTLRIIAEELRVVNESGSLPCDYRGTPN